MGNSNQEIILNCARWSTNWRIKLNKIISPVTELVLYCYMHMMLWGGCAKELNHRIERRRRSSSPLLFSVYWFLSMVLYDRNSQYWGKYLCFRLSFFPRFSYHMWQLRKRMNGEWQFEWRKNAIRYCWCWFVCQKFLTFLHSPILQINSGNIDLK